MSPQTILEKLTQRYATFDSYQDRGVVLTQFPDTEQPKEVIFSTYFSRPHRFRFEWTTHHPYPPLRHIRTHCVIYTEEGSTFLYSDRDNSIRPEENLMMAIAGATGVSRGSAHTVSQFLFPEVGGFRLDQLEDMKLGGGTYEGVACHLIVGRHAQGLVCEVLLGVDDLLIRRVRDTGRNGVVTDEIRRDIRVNQPIGDDTFSLSAVGHAKQAEA